MKLIDKIAFGAVLAVLGVAPVAPDAAAPSVSYVPAADVNAAFAKGKPLIETAGYKIQAGRREAAGQAELHTQDTDIFHVLTGSATFVTGGTIEGANNTGPEEVRGTSITGGETRTLQAGDILVIPNGVPHWFKVVPAPVTYFVVKVRTGTAH